MGFENFFRSKQGWDLDSGWTVGFVGHFLGVTLLKEANSEMFLFDGVLVCFVDITLHAF